MTGEVKLLEPVRAVPVIAAGVVPPIIAPSIVPELISMPVTAVWPPKIESIMSNPALSLVPQEFSLAPTSGFTRL